MHKNQKRTAIIAVSVIGVGTLLLQRGRIKSLENHIRIQSAMTDVYKTSFFRASNVMSTPQLIGILGDSISDVKFANIVKNI